MGNKRPNSTVFLASTGGKGTAESVPGNSRPSARLLTAEQVAEITGLSMETLAQWRCQRRGIPYVKISRNCVRYRQADLDAWLQARIVPVQPEP